MRTRNVPGFDGQQGRLAAILGQWLAPTSQPAWLKLLRGASGAQLVEFALVLPLLVVMVVGINDFAAAYNLKQKLSNAAREGARFASALSCADCWQSAPPSTQAVRDVVANYLTNANVTTCTIGSAPASAGPLAWQYSSSGCPNFSLLIERGYTFVNSNGVTVAASRVTLTYPFSWSFNKIIGMLVPGANPSLPTTITTDAIMQTLL